MAKAKTEKKTKPPARRPRALPRTYVTFLLDRSGSMSSIKPQTIEGFNTYLAGLKAEKKADILFTFLTFDTGYLDKIYVATPVDEVAFLTNDTFQPRGGTPLIDASYNTIKAVEEAVERDDTKPKVVVCIQTDGDENDSRTYGWDDLSKLVKAKQECGWQFNFLGAGIDAYKQAAKMGVGAASTMSYGLDRAYTRSAFMASAQNTASYSAGLVSNTSYGQMQKQAAGDAFDPEAFNKAQAAARGLAGSK